MHQSYGPFVVRLYIIRVLARGDKQFCIKLNPCTKNIIVHVMYNVSHSGFTDEKVYTNHFNHNIDLVTEGLIILLV